VSSLAYPLIMNLAPAHFSATTTATGIAIGIGIARHRCLYRLQSAAGRVYSEVGAGSGSGTETLFSVLCRSGRHVHHGLCQSPLMSLTAFECERMRIES